MTDLDVMPGQDDPAAGTGAARRTVRRSRGLPRGRAVVGALLVTAAAVALFAAYLDATGAPATSYLVAADRLEPGTRLAERGQLVAALEAAALDLPPELAERVFTTEELDELLGWYLVAPLERGELVTRSALVEDPGHEGAQTMSFSLPRSSAVGGSLRAGERVDVLATFGSGENASTVHIVRGVPLIHVTTTDGGALGGDGDVSLTVAISELEDVLAVGHAVNTASVFVTRSTARTEGAPAPGAHTTQRLEDPQATEDPQPDGGEGDR